jgi:hypothetical protein
MPLECSVYAGRLWAHSDMTPRCAYDFWATRLQLKQAMTNRRRRAGREIALLIGRLESAAPPDASRTLVLFMQDIF